MGHFFGQTGISADPLKTEAITTMPAPKDVSEMKSFLGMVNYLAKFIPRIAAKTKALRDLLQRDVCWCWEEPQDIVFHKNKTYLCTTSVLTYYNP